MKVALGQKRYTDDVWNYRYELVTQSGRITGLLATHAAELPAVFDVRDHEFSHFIYDGESEALFAEMARQMHGDWVRFALTGAPNPDWPRFTGADSPVRIFDRETRTVRLDRREKMALWGDLRFYEK